MKVTIHNFRGIEHLTFTTGAGEIVYFNGDSGTGKTTIFNAIVWCLYGKVNSIDPWHMTSKEEIYVSIEVDDVLIKRSKNPKALIFIKNGIVTKDILAQKEIERIYQEQQSFLATSYICQGEKHPIVTLAPKDRYLMMTRVGLMDEKPEVYFERIKTMTNLETIKVQKLNDEYDSIVRLYEDTMDKLEADCDDILTNDEVVTITEELEQLEDEVNKLESQYKSVISKEVEKNVTYSNLLDAKKKLAGVNYCSNNIYNELIETRKKWKEYTTSLEKYNKYTREKKTLDQEMTRLFKSPPSVLYNQDDIFEVERIESTIEKEKKICSSLRVDYEEKEVNTLLRTLQLQIDSQKDVVIRDLVERKLESIKEYDRQLENLPSVNKKECEVEITKIKTEKQALQSLLSKKLQELIKKSDSQKIEVSLEYERNVKKLQEVYTSKKAEKISHVEKVLDETRDELQEKKKLLQSYENSIHVHKCPHCSNSIRYSNGKIISSTEDSYDQDIHESHKKAVVSVERILSRIDTTHKEDLVQMKTAHDNELSILKKSYDGKIRLITREFNAFSDDEKGIYEKKLKQLNERLEKYTTLLTQASKYEDILSLRKELSIEIDSLPNIATMQHDIKKMTQKEIDLAKDKIKKLELLTFPEIPKISSSKMKNVLAWLQLKKAVDSLVCIEQPEKPQKNDVTDRELNDYNTQLMKRKMLETSVEELEKKYNSIVTTISSISIEEDLKEKKDTVKEYKNALINTKNANIIIGIQSNAEECEKQLLSAKKRLEGLVELNTILGDALKDSLTNLVDSVNAFLLENLPSLFSHDIEVSLETTKLLKTGKERDSINLHIKYKDGNMNGLNGGLSGGEATRISTLLSVSFARYAGSKMLILDEATASIDETRIDDLLDIIRKSLPDVTVLLTGHGHNHGNFDRVIEL